MTLWELFFFCFLALAINSDGYVANPQSSKGQNVDSCESLADSKIPQAIVIFGATGDLAKREIYPALWTLYREKLLPPKTHFFGHARRKSTVEQIRKNTEPFVTVKPGQEKLYDEFWSFNHFKNGSTEADYDELNREIEKYEENGVGNRFFHLAIPPQAFESTITQIKRACMADKGWTRLIIEKPFGRDTKSFNKLSSHISSLFSEDQVYHMDHFLGYEMVQNIISLRFANRMFAPSWNKENIAAVEIDFKENFGVEGRGGYFDDNGIIRDVIQNHLLQIVSLIAMEKPNSTYPNDVRDAKVELLKKTREIIMDDVVIGQYVANPESKDPRERIGYQDDPSVTPGSLANTFAMTVLRIDNERWEGVPFIIRAGKGLNINQTDIIIQYKKVDKNIFDSEPKRNELIIRVGKSEALKANIMSKTPGFSHNLERITVDFTYKDEYENLVIPSAYERLILDVICGRQVNFVREDELKEAWRIFTPILHEIENKKIKPIEYKFGSTGPKEADEMEKRNNFCRIYSN